MRYLLIYLLIINAAGFAVMLADKSRARKNLRRIRESTLMRIALFGGSIGSLIGMYAVRHKTKHPKFTIGIPMILTLQIILFVILFCKFL